MRNQKLVYAAVLLVTLASIGVFVYTALRATLFSPESEIAPPPEMSATTSPELHPVKLTIPRLNISANVQHVGITKSGNMGVPNNFTDVGWYKYGTVPGYRGSAVIDGHVDNGLSLPGVFKHLESMQVGDDIYIERKNGERLRFVVVEVENYPYRDVPLHRVFERNDTVRLNLITCGGSWIRNEKTYDRRVVVFTTLAK